MTQFDEQPEESIKTPQVGTRTSRTANEGATKRAIKEAQVWPTKLKVHAKMPPYEKLNPCLPSQTNESLLTPCETSNGGYFSTSRFVGTLRRQLVAAFSSDRSPIKMRSFKLSSMEVGRSCLQQQAQAAATTTTTNAIIKSEPEARARREASNDEHLDCEDGESMRKSPVHELIKLKRLSFKRRSKLSVTPTHLIRMFAERRNDSNENPRQRHEPSRVSRSQEEADLLGLLLDTPTRAVNCLTQLRDTTAATTISTSKLEAPREHRSAAAGSQQLFTDDHLPASNQSKEQQLNRLISILNSASNQNESLQNNCDNIFFNLEDSWTQLFQLSQDEDNGQQRASTSLQQDAIWELITTELSYIKRLKLIVELFQSTLIRLQQQHNLLTDIDGHLLLSNINQVLEANLSLYVNYLRPTIEASRSSCSPLDFTHFMQPFMDISNLFRPYYRYCIEQADCIGYIRKQRDSNECFKSYLAWCESQKECERLQLTDLLAHPMQRLTRYPLLLKTIAKRSQPNSGPRQQQMLAQMIAHVDRFVSTVDLELRRQDEFNLLQSISKRLQLIDSVGLEQHNNEIQTILRSYNSQFDLMVSLFECQYPCSRRLIFDSSSQSCFSSWGSSNNFANMSVDDNQHLGQLKFKDASTSRKLDVILLIFTDQIFVCRPSTANLSPSKQQATEWSPLRSSRYSLRSNDSQPTGKLNTSGQVHSMSSEGPNDGLQAIYTTSSTTATTIRPRRRAVSHSHAIPVLSSDTIDGEGCSPSGLITSRDQLQKYSTGDIVASCQLAGGLVSPSKLLARVHLLKALSNCSLPDDGRQFASSSFASHQYDRPMGFIARGSSLQQSMMRISAHYAYNPVSGAHKAHNQQKSHHKQAGARTKTRLHQLAHQAARGHPEQHLSLRAIRSPYPIERLVMHELEDGLAVLFCQLNDSNTVANSFVLHCPKKSIFKTATIDAAHGQKQEVASSFNASSSFETMSLMHRRPPSKRKSSAMQTRSCSDAEQPAKVSKQVTPASRLIDLVKQAQMQYKMAAQFHGVELVAPNQLEVIQSPCANKAKMTPNSTMPDNNHVNFNSSGCRQGSGNKTTIHKTGDLSEYLKFAIEQHKLCLLNHGKHDLLARNDFDYSLVTNGNRQYFEIKSMPISSSRQTSSQTNQEKAKMGHLPPLSRKKDSLMVPSGMTTTVSDDDDFDLPSTSMNSFSSQGNLSSSCTGGEDLTRSSVLSVNTNKELVSLNNSPRQSRARPQFSRSSRVSRTLNQSMQQREFASKTNSNCSSIPKVSIERLGQPDNESSPPISRGERNSFKSHLQASSFGSANCEVWDLSDNSEGNCFPNLDEDQCPSAGQFNQHDCYEQTGSRPTMSNKRHILSSMRQKNFAGVSEQQLAAQSMAKARPRPSPGQTSSLSRNQDHETWFAHKLASRCRQPTTLSEESTFHQSLSQTSERMQPPVSANRDATQFAVDEDLDDSLGSYKAVEAPMADRHLAPEDKREPRATSFELGSLRQESLLSGRDNHHVLATNFRSSSAEVHSRVWVTLTSPQSIEQQHHDQDQFWNEEYKLLATDSEQSESSLERKYKEECTLVGLPDNGDGPDAKLSQTISEQG